MKRKILGGGDSLCPHPTWRQENSVPARSAFTQYGRESRSLRDSAHTQYGGRGTGLLTFAYSFSAHSTPGTGSVKDVIRIPSRCFVRHGWREREGVRIFDDPPFW